MGRVIFSILLAVLLSAGVSLAQTGAEPVPETETACVDAGGRWARGGLAGQLLCFLPTPDAGAACTTGGECSGFCLAETGTCSAEAPVFGCIDILDLDGARATLCID